MGVSFPFSLITSQLTKVVEIFKIFDEAHYYNFNQGHEGQSDPFTMYVTLNAKLYSQCSSLMPHCHGDRAGMH